LVKRAGRRGGDLDAGGVGGPEAAADVEVVDGGERVVDGRGAALEDRVEVGDGARSCAAAARSRRSVGAYPGADMTEDRFEILTIDAGIVIAPGGRESVR
jgi:hypothetical protein